MYETICVKQTSFVLKSWQGKKAGSRRQLQSLFGKLGQLAKVAHGARTHCQRIIDAYAHLPRSDSQATLSPSFFADVAWLRLCLASPRWKGTSSIIKGAPLVVDIVFSSDASRIGLGAYWEGRCFAEDVPHAMSASHVSVWEMAAVVRAAASWAHEWKGKRVLCRTDNSQVVAAIAGGFSREPEKMALVRELCMLEVEFDFSLSAVHIAGKINDIADALSRKQGGRVAQLLLAATHSPAL
jgi:hypothetical protein